MVATRTRHVSAVLLLLALWAAVRLLHASDGAVCTTAIIAIFLFLTPLDTQRRARSVTSQLVPFGVLVCVATVGFYIVFQMLLRAAEEPLASVESTRLCYEATLVCVSSIVMLTIGWQTDLYCGDDDDDEEDPLLFVSTEIH